MPRDASGNYTLPAGNPVVTNTIIASAWANNTLADIAVQMNNVLTRDGLLGPTGPFKLQDGAVAAPGLAFNSEPGLGFYRVGASQINWAASGGIGLGLDFSAAAAGYMALTPRASGLTRFSLTNAPVGAANYNTLQLIQNADGTAALNLSITGTATKKQMNFGGATAYVFDAGVTLESTASAFFIRKANGASANIYGASATGLPRWLLALGSASAEIGGSQGSDLVVQRYDDSGAILGSPFTIVRQNGNISLGNIGSTVTLQGGNLLFPATQQPSAGVTTLDDYHEGTWLPTNGSFQPTVTNANYTKIGRVVFLEAQLTFAANGFGGSVQFAGLPYPCVGNSGFSIGYCSALFPGAQFTVMPSGNLINVYAGGGFATFAQLTGASLYFGGHYITS